MPSETYHRALSDETSGARPRVGVPWRTAKEEADGNRLKIEYYYQAIEAAGGEPVPISLSMSPAELDQRARTLDAIVLPGSPADVDPARYGVKRHPECADPDPARERTDYALLNHAFAAKKPVLAICYGTQLLNVYVGGTLSGSYAELSLCEQTQVHALPGNVSYPQGAGMNVPYATAFHALFHRAHGEAGESVLVHGASGGVGIAAVQLARARGLTVIGTAGTDKGRRMVAEQGAHHVLDHTAPGYLDELLKLTGGQGVDVILEMLANVNLQKDFGALAMRGRIAVIGNRGTVEINPRLAMNKNAAILGVALFHATPAQLAGIHAALVEGLRNGTLRPVIHQELPLGQAPRAHEAVMENGHHGKIVLVP